MTEDNTKDERDQSRVVRLAGTSQPKKDFGGRLDGRIFDSEKCLGSAKDLIDEWLDSIEDPELEESVRVMKSAVRLIQEDTMSEFSGAYCVYRGKYPFSTQREAVRDEVTVTDFDQIKEEDKGRAALFLLTSNLFNREDEKIETALNRGAKGKQVDSGQILDSVIKGGAASLVSGDDGKRRVTPEEYLVHLGKLGVYVGVESAWFRGKVEVIVAAQKKGLAMVDDDYTIENAVDYKVSTIGTYNQLLSGIMFADDAQKREGYMIMMMNTQIADDIKDIGEDVYSQPNPFISILKKHGLLEKFLKSGKDFDTFLRDRTLHSYMTLELRSDKRKTVQLIEDDVNIVCRDYWKCDTVRVKRFVGVAEKRE